LKAAYGKMDAVKIDLKSFSRVVLSPGGHWAIEAGAEFAGDAAQDEQVTEIVYLVLRPLNEAMRNFADWRNG